MKRIYPTTHAPYDARFVTDDFAVEYRYSLGKGLYRGRIYSREGDGRERFLSEWDTAIRSLDGADAELTRNAELAIEAWDGERGRDPHTVRMADGGDATFGRTDDGYDDPTAYA